MTSLREALARLVRRRDAPPDPAEYSYTVHWTRSVRTWPSDRRRRAMHALRALAQRSDFNAQPYGEQYRLPQADEASHDGASLMALLKVLEAFQARE